MSSDTQLGSYIARRTPGVGNVARGNAGLTPTSGSGTPPRIYGGFASLPPAQPSDTAGAIQTVADAYLAALGSQPESAGATVVVPTPPIDGDSGMNIKTVLLVAALAAAAWFLYKKFGTSSAAA